MSGDDGLDLTTVEARLVARYLATEHLAANPDIWCDWELVPQLSEGAFMAVQRWGQTYVAGLRSEVQLDAEEAGVDLREMMGRLG